MGGAIGSALLHGCVLILVLYAGKQPRVVMPAEPVEIAIVETAPAKPPPPPEPEPPEPPQAPTPQEPERPAPKRRALPPPPEHAPRAAPKAEELPPPPNETPPKVPQTTPVFVGLSLSSTSQGGSFAAPVGNTLYGESARKGADPSEVKPYASESGRYVPPHRATQLPQVLHVPVLPYPAEARKLEIEGTVVVAITVDDTGKVIKTRLVKSLGHGLDEVAIAALKQARFKPGSDGRGPIVTEITYSYTFELTE